jgi:TPR repeat protein
MQTRRIFSASIAVLLLAACLDASATSPQAGVELWHAGKQADAIALWQPLAEQGDKDAMLYIAYAYRTGQGVARNDDLAFDWYRRAAEAGVPEAQIELSLMYELGIGTAPDPGEAGGWYSMATRGEFCPSELPAGGALGPR